MMLKGLWMGLFLAAAVGAGAAELDIQTGEPGNVFYAGSPVSVRIVGSTGNAASLQASVLSYAGKAFPCGPVAASGELKLGALPRGYYVVTVKQGDRTASTGIAVVEKQALNSASPLATDAAHSWLIRPQRFEDGAELLRRAGFAWARERLSWGEVEPERGVYNWGRYEQAVNAAHRRGINVYEIFHNSPAWSRSDRAINRFPDDLRDVYQFAKTAAEHYKGRVKAWEVWNEADIGGFSIDPGDEYAAFLKAAYLGFKAGDPQVQVTQVSFAMGAGRYEDSLYRNGTGSYFDIYNYHIYDTPASYPARAQGHFDLMDRYQVPLVPVWLTEAGIRLDAPNNTLSTADRRKQAEFVPKSFVMSLASGTDRHFFFVFPHYMENGIEFGTWDANWRPYPGYAALATITDMLGKAHYLGRVRLDGAPDANAFLFDNGKGATLVAWNEGGDVKAVLPPAAARGRLYDCVGDELGTATGTLALGSAPVYLRLPAGALPANAQPLAARKNVAANQRRLPASRVVVRVRMPAGAASKELEGYVLKAGQPVPVQVEAYNFGASSRRVTVRLRAPQNWAIDPASFTAELDALGREARTATLTPPREAGTKRAELRASIEAEGGEKGAAALDVLLDPSSLAPSANKPMGLDAPEKWRDNISGNGSMSHAVDPEGGVAFDVRFSAPGDRWAYPTVDFAAPADWRGYEALSMEVAAGANDPDTTLRVMVGETSGAVYYTTAGFPAEKTWRRIIVPFDTLEAGGFAPSDPNGKLDLNRISFLRFGCNTTRYNVTLRLRNLALVKFGR